MHVSLHTRVRVHTHTHTHRAPPQFLPRRNTGRESGLAIVSVAKKCLAWPSFLPLAASSFSCVYWWLKWILKGLA